MTTNNPTNAAKRYMPISRTVPYPHVEMREHSRGDYVRREDYEALQAECEQLRKNAELSRRVLDFALEYWRERYQRPFDYADAYQGAREDLAIWKRRALEAERRVRKQDQIIDRMSDDLNAISGPTFMGEPVLLKRPVPDVSELVEALEVLVSEIESNTCPHDNTYRGGAIWEVCEDCGEKWADDMGGKPEFAWPESVEAARNLIHAHRKQGDGK